MTSVTIWAKRRLCTGFRASTTGWESSRTWWTGYRKDSECDVWPTHWTILLWGSNRCAGSLPFQIKICDTCQHTERKKNQARTVRPIKVDAPWDIVGIDIIGSLIHFQFDSIPNEVCCVFSPHFDTERSSHQGLSQRPGKATPASQSSSITSVNGLRPFRFQRQTRCLLPDAFPNAYTGEHTTLCSGITDIWNLY